MRGAANIFSAGGCLLLLGAQSFEYLVNDGVCTIETKFVGLYGGVSKLLVHQRENELEIRPCLAHCWTANSFPDVVTEDSVFGQDAESYVNNLLEVKGRTANSPRSYKSSPALKMSSVGCSIK